MDESAMEFLRLEGISSVFLFLEFAWLFLSGLLSEGIFEFSVILDS